MISVRPKAKDSQLDVNFDIDLSLPLKQNVWIITYHTEVAEVFL